MAKRPATSGYDLVDKGFMEAPPPINEWRRFLRVFFARGMVSFGLVVLVLMIFVAIFAGWIAPYDHYEIDLRSSLAQPSNEHLLGTDNVGRDTLSRLFYGARTALIVGFVTIFTAAIIGVVLGLIAGFAGGILSMLIMRTMDALMCFPMIILAILISAVLGGGMKNVIIALTFASVPVYARVVNGMTLSIKQNDYIMAEKAMGSSSARIVLGHILPNSFPPIIVLITLQLGNIILAEAGLSFLSIGISPPEAAWGSMVNEGRKVIFTNQLAVIWPALAIATLVIGLNLFADGLREELTRYQK